MRNREPRVGRASATKWGLILPRQGANPLMNHSAGSTMDVWYRALFLANHSRSLCRFSCRRNTKTSGLKKGVSAIKIPSVQSSVYRLRSACLYLPPDQHCKLHGIVNSCLQLGTWLDGLSPQPNGCNQAGGYEQCTTFTFFWHASQCRRTKSE